MRQLLAGVLVVVVLAGAVRADVDGLIRDLGSKDSDIRRQAAKQLSEMGPEAKDAFSALVKALKDEDVFVRRFAVQALGAIGSEQSGTIEALTRTLKDRDKRVVNAAVDALAKMGTAGVKPLIDMLKEKNAEAGLKLKAVQAMGKAGKGAKDAVPALMEIVKGPTKGNDPMGVTLRTEAATALGDIGPDAKEAVTMLSEIANDKKGDRGFKLAVQQALNKIQK